MSFTNMRLVPGSYDISIGRAGSPLTSGSVANSTKFTLMTPSSAGIGLGNGSRVPFGPSGGGGF